MKAVRVTQAKPDAVVLGSSLVDNMLVTWGSAIQPYSGMNPRQDELASLLPADSPVYFNAAIRGGSMVEHHAMFKHALLNNPAMKHIILGLSVITFLPGAPTTPNPNIPIPDLLGKTYVPPSVYLRNLFDWGVFNTSLDIIALNNPTLRPGIEMLRPWLRLPGEILTLLVANAQASARSAKEVLSARRPNWIGAAVASPKSNGVGLLSTTTSGDKQILPPDTSGVDLKPWPEGFSYFMENVEIEKRYLSYICYTDYVFGSFENMYADENPKPLTRESFTRLREMSELAAARGFRFDVFLTAHHNALWYRLYEAKKGFPFIREWLKALVDIQPVWELTGLLEDSPDPSPFFDQEPLHMILEAGRAAIPAIIAGKEKKGMIQKIDKTNVDAFIESHEKKVFAWGEKNELFYSIYKALPKYIEPKGPDFCYPKSFQDRRSGMVVLHLFGKYYARLTEGGKARITDVLADADPRIFAADSLDAIKIHIAGKTSIPR